ncbi:MAG TPA: MFS transporter, partial [Haliangium sp.]|nr:MFS transporter [Haliangium sp.]
ATAPATPDAGPGEAPAEAPGVAQRSDNAVAAHLYQGLIAPFFDLVRRHGLVTVLLLIPFVLLFKLGDAFAATMSNVFLADIGFTNIEIASIAKTYGLVATIFGVMLGGWLVRALGLLRALWIGGLVQMASNLMYTLQAQVGADSWVLTATIGVENLSGGVGDAAFVAYLSSLCNRSYSATQYALLAALAGLVRNIASMYTGHWATDMGWPGFFRFTAVAAVPGLVMLYALGRWLASRSSPARA